LTLRVVTDLLPISLAVSVPVFGELRTESAAKPSHIPPESFGLPKAGCDLYFGLAETTTEQTKATSRIK
jgi:hypothetical protein